ncbi:MAG: hypothetical protein ACKVZJ_15225 [Phycisphaerales bacterium]
MTFTTSRTNLSRERHLTRAAVLAALCLLLAVPGAVFVHDAVLAMPFIRTDGAANAVWTLWCLPVLWLGASATLSLLAGLRSAPSHRASVARCNWQPA